MGGGEPSLVLNILEYETQRVFFFFERGKIGLELLQSMSVGFSKIMVQF